MQYLLMLFCCKKFDFHLRFDLPNIIIYSTFLKQKIDRSLIITAVARPLLPLSFQAIEYEKEEYMSKPKMRESRKSNSTALGRKRELRRVKGEGAPVR